MEILSVFDSAFKPYGKVVTGMEDTCKEILTALAAFRAKSHVNGLLNGLGLESPKTKNSSF